MTSVLVVLYLADRGACDIALVVLYLLIEVFVKSHLLYCTLLIEVLLTSVLVVLYLADRGACDIALVVLYLADRGACEIVLVLLYFADRGACDNRIGCTVPC